MIAAFITEKMSAYIAGGISPEIAAHFTRGELAAIYQGTHYSRDGDGPMRLTPPPENLGIETAMKKADAAIAEIISQYPAPVEKPRSVYRSSDAIKRVLAAGIGIKPFFAKSKDNDPEAYTADLKKVAALWNEGQRRFKAFIRGRFLALDIDRKPGKPDGLEAFYRLFPRETLPVELQGLPKSFPCYVQTPSSGFHLYFRYEGPELNLRELATGIEVKEWQITCPGSRRENGEYVLHGELDKAPPLYGLIIDAIEETKRKKELAKAERSRPRVKAVADRPVQYKRPRITLDDLADEATAAHAGNHDRQVSFAGKVCRLQMAAKEKGRDYGDYTQAAALAYVKSRADIFGNDADTENTALSVFRDNGGCL
jgi:hypothetical protein